MDFTQKKKIPAKCPKCQKVHQISIEEIAQERVIQCSCGANIRLKDEGKGMKKVTDSVDNLKRTIDKFNRKS
jgi:phage FluMu protein Com